MKKFIMYIDEVIINYPKREYVLKDRILYYSYDILELIYKANFNKERYHLQMDILSKLSMLDFCLEMSLHKKIISEKKLKSSTNMLSEIAKMVYGWVDADKNK